MPTAVAAKTYKLYSRACNQLLIRRPLDERDQLNGARIRVSEHVGYDFSPDGTLEVRDGQDLLMDGPYDAEGNPTEQDAMAWLRAHPLLNHGFHIEGEEPDRPLPTETDFLSQVTAAVSGLQADPIRELLDHERARHNRGVLIAVAENALAQVETVQAEMDKQKADAPA